jgi:hypothetical protein
MDRPLDLPYVESPTAIEEFSVTDQTVGAVREAFAT